MIHNKEIRDLYNSVGLRLKRRHINQIYDKEAHYNWLKNMVEGIPQSYPYLDREDGTSFQDRYLKMQMKLRYFKQSKLRKTKYKVFKNIVINYPQCVDQPLRERDNTLLSDYEKKRWKSHLKHPLINQLKIRDAKIVSFGVGGIGSSMLYSLIYSGVQNIRIVDFDEVGPSNLNRQSLYTPTDIGKLKNRIAQKRCLEMNPHLNIKSYNLKIEYPIEQNLLKRKNGNIPNEFHKVEKLIKWSDIVGNLVDFYGAPYLINDLCIKYRKPYYWALNNHSLGEIFSFSPNENSACLRCIFGPLDFFYKTQVLRYRTPTTKTAGSVLGATVFNTGSFIASMIINDICGIEDQYHGKYLLFDSDKFKITKIPIRRYKKCECQHYLKHKG